MQAVIYAFCMLRSSCGEKYAFEMLTSATLSERNSRHSYMEDASKIDYSPTQKLSSTCLLLPLSEPTLFNHTEGMIYLNLSSNILDQIHPDILRVADYIDLSNNRLRHIPEPLTSHDELPFTQEKHTECGMYDEDIATLYTCTPGATPLSLIYK